jgi:hypothetical protein
MAIQTNDIQTSIGDRPPPAAWRLDITEFIR